MKIHDIDADEIHILPTRLVARLKAWGRVRGLTPTEAATTLLRDRLTDLERRATSARKLTEHMTTAEKSARGRSAVKARWARHFANKKKPTR